MQRVSGVLSILMGMLSLLSCWYIALRLYRAWWSPMVGENGTWVHFGVGIMVLEFIVVHSGGMLSGLSISAQDSKKRRSLLTGLVVFYFGAAFLISRIFKSEPLFYSFCTIMFCRLITGFFSVSEKNSSAIIQRSAMSGVLYLFVCFVSIIVPFPEGGLAPRVLDLLNVETEGEGIWNREPQRALAAGIIYFFLMGVYEMFAVRQNLQRSAQAAAAEAQFYGRLKG